MSREKKIRVWDKSEFNYSTLCVSQEFDEDGEIELDIIGGSLHDRSIWLNKEQVKELINVLLNAL